MSLIIFVSFNIFLFSDFFLFSIPFHTYIEKRSNKTDHFIHWHNSWFLPSSVQHLMSWNIRFVQSTIQVYEFQSVSSVVRKCFKLSLSLSTWQRCVSLSIRNSWNDAFILLHHLSSRFRWDFVKTIFWYLCLIFWKLYQIQILFRFSIWSETEQIW